MSAKRQTTMAKLMRERKVQEKRERKLEKKHAAAAERHAKAAGEVLPQNVVAPEISEKPVSE